MGRRLAGIAVVASAGIAAVWPGPGAWVEQHYSRGTYPPLQRLLTPVSNAAPFAMLDVLLIAAIVLVALAAISVLRAPPGVRAKTLGRRVWQAAVAGALVYIAFLVIWGLNYRRAPLEASLDFDGGRVTPEAVIALNDAAVVELGRLRPRLAERTVARPSRDAISRILVPALDRGTRLLALPARVAAGRPKTSLLDPFFRGAGVSGMTDPFFLETLLASNVLPFEQPAVIAHEWGHLAGLARESEASLFGLVVCLHGDDTAQYSAWLEIFLHTLVARDAAGRREVRSRLPALVRADLDAMAERTARDQIKAVSLAAWRTYDGYLRSQRVASGVRNYGEVVRLLVGTRFSPGWDPVLRGRH